MSQFDMSQQQVGRQYIAGRDMTFGHVQSSEDLLDILEQLRGQIAQARAGGVIDNDTATDTQYHMTKAIDQMKKPDPDKKTVVDHLSMAKSLLETVTAASGLVPILIQAIQAIQHLSL